MSNLTAENIVKSLIGISIAIVTAFLVYRFANLVGYAIVAAIFSYILDPVINRMQSTGMNRTLAITMCLSSLVLILAWISTSVFPIVVSEMVQLTQQLNMQNIQLIASKIEQQISSELPFLKEGFLVERLTEVVTQLLDIGQLPNALSNIISVFTNIFSAFLVIPFATFFFLKDGSQIRRYFLQFVPNKYFETALSLVDKIETRLGLYFKGVIFQSFMVALVSFGGLKIVGLDNALSVGIAVGVANTIPYFGPIIGYILSIIISIIETGDFSLILPSILAIFFAQIMDNAVFQPLIFSKSADMHPLAILFVILLGAELAGILGMLVAVPVATVIKITINQISWSLNNYYVFQQDA